MSLTLPILALTLKCICSEVYGDLFLEHIIPSEVQYSSSICEEWADITKGGYKKHENGSLIFFCDANFHLKGPSLVNCIDGHWEPQETPMCLPNYCVKPVIANGAVFNPLLTYKPNDKLTIYCNEGYRLFGSKQLMCNDDGSWTSMPNIGEKPFCAETLCSHPEELPNGSIEIDTVDPSIDRFKTGSRAIYKCNVGYQLSMVSSVLTNSVSSNVRICLPQGQWSGSAPLCEALSCGLPPHIVNGYYEVYPGQGDSDLEGDRFPPSIRLHYLCYLGYSMQGAGILQCSAGAWNPSQAPVCNPLPNLTEPSKRCPLPQNISHASVTLLQGWMGPSIVADGTVLQYMCHHGYRDLLQPCSVAKVICKRGVWQGSFPSCASFSGCLAPPQILHGQQLGQASQYYVNSKVYYKCNTNYALLGPPVITCQSSGCWLPPTEPWCEVLPNFPMYPPDQYQAGHYDNLFHGRAMTLISIAGASMVVLLVITIILLQRRYKSYHTLRLTQHHGSLNSNPTPEFQSGSDTDRVALIAFADGVQVVLPSYEEAIQAWNNPPPYDSVCRTPQYFNRGFRQGLRRFRSRDHDNILSHSHITHSRQNLQSVSLADSIGSADTITHSLTGSEVSTALTMDTTSSNASSSSQAHSCRALAGSFASFDTVSNVITDDVPLLEVETGTQKPQTVES